VTTGVTTSIFALTVPISRHQPTRRRRREGRTQRSIVCAQVARALGPVAAVGPPLACLPTARQMPPGVVPQRSPDLSPPRHGQANEKPERALGGVEAQPLADLPEAEHVARVAIHEAPPCGFEHQVNALFLLVLGHLEAIRAQPEITHGLFHHGQIEFLLKARVDQQCFMQSVTT